MFTAGSLSCPSYTPKTIYSLSLTNSARKASFTKENRTWYGLDPSYIVNKNWTWHDLDTGYTLNENRTWHDLNLTTWKRCWTAKQALLDEEIAKLDILT
jgi:hypothetical protein